MLMDKIFKYGATFEYYYQNGYSEIDDQEGIYSVILPKNFTLEYSDELPERCKKEFDCKYLYIGKAGSSLRDRIRQYTKFLYFEGDNHKGGYPIRLIKNCEKLIIRYVTISDMEVNLKKLYMVA